MKVAFFGTPAFAAESLRSLYNSGIEISAVITAPDKPAGRGQKLQMSEVKKTALELGMTVLQPVKLKSQEFIDDFNNLNVDLAVVIAFRMLPEIIWNSPKLGTVNLHASLLPDYRGAAPINHVLINGEKNSGVSTFFLKHEIDTGDIIQKESIEITSQDNASTLHDKLMILGAKTIVSTVQLIDKYRDNIPTTPQDNLNNLKFAPKINKEFCELTHFLNTVNFHNKVRGLSYYPGAWIKSPWGDLKILSTNCSITDEEINRILQNGISIEELFYLHSKRFYAKTSDGIIEITELQAPGKSKMKTMDFINGLRL